MHVSWPARLLGLISVAALVAVGALGAPGRAQASVRVKASPAVPASFSVRYGDLTGVAATSPANAWAVGQINPDPALDLPTPLLLRWNGKAWSRAAIPFVHAGALTAIAAVSATDAWVVGSSYNPDEGIWILHWNGKKWTTAPNVSQPGYQGVAIGATPKHVWVTGYNGRQTEFLHLTGGRWYVVPTSLPKDSQVTGLAMTSDSLAWATGLLLGTGSENASFLLRWNGSVWKAAPDPTASDMVTWGMASGPGGAVWVVGSGVYTLGFSLSMLWNGKSWQVLNLPTIGGFWGVAAIPGGTAWGVGWNQANGDNPVIALWTGSSWKLTWEPIISADVYAAAATSPVNGWAVGKTKTGTLILHWNGKTWS
jgi:hypothetical protein